jgi:outer membrane protein assembly factor BamB/DNA-directed RNA polymerase subunit RPC12/RpoP
MLYCFSLQTGELFWKTPFHLGGFMRKHDKNSHASPTPISDGVHVFVPYIAADSLWLSAISLNDGQVALQTRMGPFVSEWGYASSPALYRDLVIVAGDNKGAPYGPGEEPTSYLVAVNRTNGAVVWRVPRPLSPSYGTPIVARLAGRDQLLISGAERIASYDPATGKERWFCRWSGFRSASAVVWGDNRVCASTHWPRGEVVCVRADGSGDVSDTHVVWRHGRNASDVSSPLYYGGRLYLITDTGIASCLDGATGESLWQRRLGAPVAASAVLAGDRILATDERGSTHVFQAGGTFNLLARNSLDDPVLASPALSGDRLLLRSRRFLWCIDGKATSFPRTLFPSSSEARLPSERAPRIRDGIRSLTQEEERARLLMASTRKDGGQRSYTMIVLAALQFLLLLVLGGILLVVHMRRGAPERPESSAGFGNPQSPTSSTKLVFACSGCRKKLRGTPQMAGKRIRCPQCGSVLLVPGCSTSS